MRTRRTSRRSAPRRKLVWARSPGSTTFTATTPAAPLGPFAINLLTRFEEEFGASLIGATVVRVRGLMSMQPSVPANNIFGAAAIRVCDASDIAAPTDVSDNPIVVQAFPASGGSHLDWMCYEPFLGGIDPGTEQSPLTARVIDVKSSRKIEEVGQQLGLFASADSGAAAGVQVDFRFHLSVLLMLP